MMVWKMFFLFQGARILRFQPLIFGVPNYIHLEYTKMLCVSTAQRHFPSFWNFAPWLYMRCRQECVAIFPKISEVLVF